MRVMAHRVCALHSLAAGELVLRAPLLLLVLAGAVLQLAAVAPGGASLPTRCPFLRGWLDGSVVPIGRAAATTAFLNEIHTMAVCAPHAVLSVRLDHHGLRRGLLVVLFVLATQLHRLSRVLSFAQGCHRGRRDERKNT